MWQGLLQIFLTLLIPIGIAPFLGSYMAKVFQQEPTGMGWLISLERVLYSLGGVRPQLSMKGWQYARAMLFSNLVMGVFVYLILAGQALLPFNPTNVGIPSWDLALHTTISFLTNTNQQHYSGETTYSYFAQTAALGFLFFTSAATGIAVAIAFIRGMSGKPIGNFYVDLTRSITRILLPLSILGGTALLLGGVPETLAPPAVVQTLEGATQVIARGPVAHFEIIKQLGENGGGFFAQNSAHPYENPTPFTNLIETVAMVLIPMSLILTFGEISGNRRQGWLLFGMVLVLVIPLILLTAIGEFQGNPAVHRIVGATFPNLEGKEVRFGWAQSALWAVLTTATMTGAVNGMHDSLMPQGTFTTLFNMFLQVIWGGQGTGTAYLFMFLILTVFLTGLMVGRTPEFLGRKIEKREIVFASIILLVHPITILIPTALAITLPQSVTGVIPGGFHNLAQMVYEYTSAAANNGSGMEGLADGSLWWNVTCSIVLVIARYLPLLALIFLAEGMAEKPQVPESAGTLHTDTLIFTTVTGGSILILGVLTFFPVFILGPIAEFIQLQNL